MRAIRFTTWLLIKQLDARPPKLRQLFLRSKAAVSWLLGCCWADT